MNGARCDEAGAENGAGSRPGFERRPTKLRSRVTNGKALFVAGNGRSPWARRLRDIIEAHVLDQGGADLLTEGKRALIRRASALTVELERIEGRFSTDTARESDFGTYTTGANTLRRLLESIGLERVARDITPDLRTYLANSEAQP
jgi:hypothetical protein